ncbi:hypothetical protein H1R20_g3198, partial [Candolleomyces eurysporus]
MPSTGKSGSKGSSRRVNVPYLHRSGPDGGGSSKAVFNTLGLQALSAAHDEAEKDRAAVQHLLGPRQHEVFANICHEAHEASGDFDIDADVEEVPVTLDDITSLGNVADAVMDVIYDQQITRFPRGWRARTTQFHENWGNIDDLASAFLQWKNSSSTLSSANTNDAGAPLPTIEFDLELVDMFSQQRQLHVSLPDSKTIVPHLIVQGYLPTSPIKPLAAISLRTLEFYKILRQRKPSFSVESFTKKPYQRRWRRLFADSFELYLTITNAVEKLVSAALDRSSEHWRVRNACPACMYELEGEPTLQYRLEIAMDGNDLQKRMKDKGTAGDAREYTCDYMIPMSEVDAWSTEPTEPQPDDEVLATEDSTEDDTVKECVKNWKAAQSDSRKKAVGIFDETGWFAIRRTYPLSIVNRALNVLGPRLAVGYDIGCKFETTIKNSALGRHFSDSNSRSAHFSLLHTIISASSFHMDPRIASTRYHIVFGTARAGIYPPGTPVTTNWSGNSALPIVIVCATSKQAESVQKLNELGGNKLTKAPVGLPRIRLFLDSIQDFDVGLLSRSSPAWYAVWELHYATQEIHRTIFTHYSDYGHLANSTPGVHSSRQHRKFCDIVPAVVWLLARGDSQFLINNSLSQYLPPADRRKVYDTPDTSTRNLDPNVISVSDDEDQVEEELPQASDLVTPPSRQTATPKSKAAKTLTSPAPASTQKAKSKTKRSLTPTDDMLSQLSRPAPHKSLQLPHLGPTKSRWLSKANVPTNSFQSAPAPSISTSSMSTSISSTSTLMLTLWPSVALSKRSHQASTDSTSSAIAESLSSETFMRHRAIDGTVTGSMRYDDPALQSHTLPFSQHLPLNVIDYIRSHGYGRDMMVLVETALAAAGKDELNFIKAMGLQNHPGAEAGFIWRLAHNSHAL